MHSQPYPLAYAERLSLTLRLWAKLELSPSCWLWMGGTRGGTRTDPRGVYGQIWFRGKPEYVHRVMFFLVHGHMPIQVDHNCRVQLCCNPKHLEGVTQEVNLARRLFTEAEQFESDSDFIF